LRLKKTNVRVFFDSFYSGTFCLNGQIGTCLLGTGCTTFSPLHRPWEPQCTA